MAFDLDELDRRLLSRARQEIPADLRDGDVLVDRRLRLDIAQRIDQGCDLALRSRSDQRSKRLHDGWG